MELNLTGGVLFSLLCNIKKKPLPKRETRNGKEDPSSELEMMLGLWRIVRGHEFTLNKESLRSKLTQYKKCEKNGDSLIPLEAKFSPDGEAYNSNTYLFNKEATYKRIAIFIDTFIDCENKKAIEIFVNTINQIIEEDDRIYQHNSDNDLYATIINNESETMTLNEYLFEVIYLVITSHSSNLSGKGTLDHVQHEDYYPREYNLKVEVKETPSELIRKYTKELETPVNAREGWEEYLKTLKKEFTKVKIYYDPDREYPFNEIYVPSSISTLDPYGIRTEYDTEYRIDLPTVKKIAEYSNSVVISGAGGMGKTMLLRHLLLDALDNDVDHLPIFVSVRNFTDKHKTFMEFVYEQCVQYYPQLELEELLFAFTSQRCILFLDGFDEIPFEYLHSFVQLYNRFVRTDLGNIIIMSSRPVGGGLPNHFTRIFILPFSFSQSCNLVDKLTSIQHNTVLRDKFINELKTKLFNSHKDFAENPLLLTLMLRIYEQNASIPNEKFEFYYNAYEVLSHKHDALKEDGGFSRKYKTGLNPTDFANCFKEFCTYSLLRDGKISFSESEMLEYFDMIKIKKENKWDFELKDFIYDATASTGLMYLQGNRYIFIHRSIQEFFCAWFLSKQEDSVLYNIAMQLQTHGKGLVWETLELLDERIHYKMEKYVYLPYFNSIFVDYDKSHDDYTNFLFRFFNSIRYHHADGKVTFWTEIEPEEPLYYYCMKDRRNSISDTDLDLPEDESLESEDIFDFYIRDGELTTGGESEMPCGYDTEKYGEPELVGHFYEFDMTDVLSRPELYKELIEIIYNDNFPIKIEFELARKFWSELQTKYKDEGSNTLNLFDLLH